MSYNVNMMMLEKNQLFFSTCINTELFHIKVKIIRIIHAKFIQVINISYIEKQNIKSTIITHGSLPSSITSSVTLPSHVITGTVISAMSHTLLATILSKPPIFALCLKKKTCITFSPDSKSNLKTLLKMPYLTQQNLCNI